MKLLLITGGALITAIVVGLWGLWPLWGRPLDPDSVPRLPRAELATRRGREPGLRRRAMTPREKQRVAVGAIAIALAIGGVALIIHTFREVESAIHGMHE